MRIPDTANLADYFLFQRLEDGLGHKTAVSYGERHYSYELVAQRTRALTSLLLRTGVRRGERVLIVLPDCPPFAWVFFGILARGAVVAMGNPDASTEQIDYLIGYTRASAVVTVPKVAERISTRRLAELVHVWLVPDTMTGEDPESPTSTGGADTVTDLAADLGREGIEHEPVPIHKDEPAVWLFTSGSTGEPKANIHSNRDFIFSTEVYAKSTVAYARKDVTVSVPRLFFGYATGTNLMFPFAVGATVGLFSERPTPETLCRAIEQYRATVVTNVPTMLGKLLDHDEAARQRGERGLEFSSVRFSLSAGEALPEALLRRWQARFGSDIYDGIGSAEMFHIYASNRPGDIKPGSLGRVVAGYELRILPEEAEGSGAVPCAPGEVGVLWVKGDSVSHGYWLDRDKSWKTFHGHWCRTGDLFSIDADGYLYFAGRVDDLLKVSGLWVAPVEVEECLMAHAKVSLAAVIGVEDEGLMKIKAFVVLRAEYVGTGGSELEAELQDHVRSLIAKHKYPRAVEFVLDIPKNDRGKVDRKALRVAEASRFLPATAESASGKDQT